MNTSITTNDYKYSKWEVIKALRYHFISKREIKYMVIVLNIFTIVTAILFAFKKISGDIFITCSFLWLLIFMLIWWGLPLIIWRKEETFKVNLSIAMDNGGLTITAPKGKQFWPWDKFSMFVNSPDFFYMYLSNSSFFLIPKSKFNHIDALSVYDFLKNHVKEK
jgi:hypothetical protein